MTDALELRQIVDQLCRNDFRSFAIRAFPVVEPNLLDPARHIDIICRLLEKVTLGIVLRALVCIPPRHLKTYLISIAYTAWLLGKNPSARIICVSYGAALAEKFNADTLKLMKSPWYKRIFPGTILDPKKQSATEIGTTSGGYRFATSIGATLPGRGADIIIIDDPLKANEAHSPTARESCIDWFNTTVHTRSRRLREVRGWSQEGYADRADIHRTYVSDIERGRRNPTITVVEKLAQPFDVTASQLLD